MNEETSLKMISNVSSKLPPFAAGSGHTCLPWEDCLGRNASLDGLSVRLTSQEMKTAVSKELFAALAEGLTGSVAIQPNQRAIKSSLLIEESRTHV